MSHPKPDPILPFRGMLAMLLVIALSAVTAEAQQRQGRRPDRSPVQERQQDPGQEQRGEQDVEAAQPAADQPEYEDLSVSEHDAAGLRFRAVAGMQPLNDTDGELRGNMFFVYYAALGDDGKPLHETQDRPVTYVFNGGPGAASIWLHMGTAGPFRVPLEPDGNPTSPPYKAQENPHTWLDVTDLVFIDPIGTGFSRAAGEEPNPRMFWGVYEDRQWVAEFIRLHATRFERWDDPKFLAGESYGTTRAAQLASYLHERYGLDMNGIMLISAVLDFATIREAENNPLPYVLFLPSYTASAFHHGKLPSDLQENMEETLKQAETFAIDEYMPAMMKGTGLGDEERQAIAEKYARFTGLPVEYVLMSDLRVPPQRFMKALLNEQRQVIGRMDGRIAGVDTDPVNDTPSFDPALTGYRGVYTGAFADYVRNRLNFRSDLSYEALGGVGPWQGTPETSRNYSGGYLNVADDLREAIVAVPSMQVLLASGRYDLATPYFAADYTMRQLRLPPELQDNIHTEYYEGGHMMYHVESEQEKLHDDIVAFIRNAVPTTQAAD